MANRIIQVLCFENSCTAGNSFDENDVGGADGVERIIDDMRDDGWTISEAEEDQRFGFADAEIMGQCPDHTQKVKRNKARKWWKRAHRAIRVMRRNHRAAELDLLLFTTPDKKDGD